MGLTRFAINRPVIIAMATIALFVYGLVSYFSLGVNLFPSVSFPDVIVSASYPGASPSEMEKLVVKPIEDQIDGIENLDKLTATIQEGTATIVVQFKLDTDLDYAATQVQQRVDQARVNLPSDLNPPDVEKLSNDSDNIITEALSSRTLTPTALSDIVNDRILPDLKAVGGINSVDTRGVANREFHVYPDPLRLFEASATLPDVFNAVANNNASLPGGRMDSPTKEVTGSVRADLLTAADIAAVPVAVPGGAPANLRVGDLATVDDGHVEDRTPTRLEGAPAIVLDLNRQITADTVKTTAAVRSEFAALAQQYPQISFREIDANADYTQASVNGVLQSLIEGIILTAIVMLLFLHAWRNAAVVMIAIPTSLFATFVVMKIVGFTIDVISLMGLGLTIGILVDDSIVVLENITRHRDMGEGPLDAAYRGRTEIGQAAITITLVDVVVFLPIAFLSGIVGKFMKEFGLVIVVATLFSLLVSFTLTPLLAGRWTMKHHSKTIPGWAKWFQDAFASLNRWYVNRVLPWALGHRWAVIGGCAALVAGAISLVPLGFIGGEFIPSANSGIVLGTVTYPIGTPLATTQAGLDRLSTQLARIPAVSSVITTGGVQSNGFSTTIGGNVGRFTVILDKTKRRETNDVLDAARPLGWTVPGAEYDVKKESGAGTGVGIAFTVTGPTASLVPAAQKIAAVLRAQKGAANVQDGTEANGPRLDIRIDPARAAVLGVSPGVAASAARMALGGAIATKVRTETGLVDVWVEFAPNVRNSMTQLRDVQVRANNGSLVPLSAIAEFVMTKAPTIISREARQRVLRVTADVDASSGATLQSVLEPTRRIVDQPGFLPSGIKTSLAGDSDLFNQTFQSMGFALLTSFALVYMLMVVLYGSFVEPFVVMFSVPVAIVGALAGLAVRHQTLNLFSLIAIVMLFGLVSKNGILLVDYANQQLRRGLPVREAIAAAASTRFRPILMTTSAMVFGMLPLSLGLTEGAETRSSMGTVLIGGLLSSLILTLVLVPVVYTGIMSRVERREEHRAARASGELPELEPAGVPR